MSLAPALLAIAGCDSSSVLSHRTAQFVHKDCATELAAAGAVCGTVSVAENRALPAGRRIDLNVIVFPARSPSEPRMAQFDLEGGPGFAVTESAAFYATDGALYRESRDVVLADMRGTGLSNPLRCESIEAYAKREPWPLLYPPDLVAECASALSTKADLRQYTTAAAAKDLDEVREALGYPEIDLNALSYGTTLALRYINDFPEHVRSAVLTGTVPADRTPPRFHAGAGQDGLRLILDACAAEPACAVRFPDPPTELEHALAGMDDATRPVFLEKIRTMLYLPAAARRVPSLIHKAAAGDTQAIVKPGVGRPFSDAVYLSITCAESIARMDVPGAIADADRTVFGAYRLTRQSEACERWPVAPFDPYLFDLRAQDIPVLFLSGRFDPVSPPAWATQVAARFPNGRQIVIPQGGHVMEGMTGMDTCLDAIVLEFVTDRSASEIDTHCVDSMSAGAFALD